MSYNKHMGKLIPLIVRLPEGQHFDNGCGDEIELKLQCNTQDEFAKVRAAFPGSTWEKEWNPRCKWWEYRATYDGVSLQVYACYEGPRSCKAITETRTVTKQIPVTFETSEVEETVIVGWDCGDTP